MGDEVAGSHVLVSGAAGMLGRKLAAALAGRGHLDDQPIARLTLVDVTEPELDLPDAPVVSRVDTLAKDLVDPEAATQLVADRPDVVFHLAAVVSGQAEADLELGYAVNLDATRRLFDAIRAEGERASYRPRVVFASSIAVFGAPFPPRIDDRFHTTPATSYGAQKAIGELLLSDASRRGFLDGIALRLPTICIRPGSPNLAASGFFSNILREPLVGEPAVLPVDDSVRHWFASPRAAVGFLEHAATLELDALGHGRAVNMPGVSATVADQIEALRRVAGEGAVGLIRREPDPAIERMVASWPQDLEPRRARQLGFEAEASFDEIVQAHIEDELGGRLEAWEKG